MMTPILIEQPKYKAGYRTYKWNDDSRQRPVWVNVWYPASIESDEKSISYGLGNGSVARDAEVAEHSTLFPLVVLSHGTSGSALSYRWLAEFLARNGFVVLGLSHYGDSWRYGKNSQASQNSEESNVSALFSARPLDATFAIDQIFQHETFKTHLDPVRIAAIGHSAGGATVVSLAGAIFDPVALRSYCQSEAAKNDRGCFDGQELRKFPTDSSTVTQSYRDPRIKAIVLLDPAAGPGYSEASLAQVQIPALVIGSEDNDFLPFENHAARYATFLPQASLIKLNQGEGHFIFLNVCTSQIVGNGVPLCIDREGVNRQAVHMRLAPEILNFLSISLRHSGNKND